MNDQTVSVTKKIGRPSKRPTGVVRLPKDVLARVEEWAGRREPPHSTVDAVERLLTIGLDYVRHMDGDLEPCIVGLDFLQQQGVKAWSEGEPDRPPRDEAIRRLVDKALR